MPAVVILHDARGRAVPLARRTPALGCRRATRRITEPGIDGLAGGLFKSKRLKKFWNKYRKPIVGGVLAAGAVGGALFTGGATLAAVPAVLGTVAKGAGSVLGATGGAGGLLSAAGSLIGGRSGGGGGGDEAPPPVSTAVPVASVPDPSPSGGQRLPVAYARVARAAPTGGLAGIPTPVLIGGGVALLAMLMLMQQRSATPHIIEVRRP